MRGARTAPSTRRDGPHHDAAARAYRGAAGARSRRRRRRACWAFLPVPAGPVPGYVLIADRNNDRLLIVSPSGRVVWRFPRPGDVRPGQSFHDPDDAFFTPGYRAISINEEFNETASIVAVRAHRIVWSFGHAGVAGSSFGYLSNPDDAYLLKNGLLMVADIKNCRVLFIDHAKKRRP